MESEFLDADDFPPASVFRGRGIGYWRSDLPSIDESGYLSEDPDGTFITFESRSHASYSVNGDWQGHAQHDVNQFTVHSRGKALFYDSGYETYGQHTTAAHNLHQVYDGSTWRGFSSQDQRTGRLVLADVNATDQTMFFLGDNSEDWDPGLVSESRRAMFIVGNGTEDPYLLVHDDIDYTGTASRKAQFYWHTGILSGESGWSISTMSNTTTVTRQTAAATMQVLSPSLVSTTYDLYTAPNSTHQRVVIETATRPNADVIALVGLHEWNDPAPVVASAVATTAGGWAYEIAQGSTKDLVVLRRSGYAGTWGFNYAGHEVAMDGQYLLLRFGTLSPDWSSIQSVAMAGGSFATVDGRIVVGMDVSDGMALCVADEGRVTIRTEAGATFGGYIVGPFVPTTQSIDGVVGSVEMLDVPHPLTCCAFPMSIGRSPVNDVVSSGFEYSYSVSLVNWQGDPIVGWPGNRALVDFWDCDQTDVGVAADGVSDGSGVVTWSANLRSGGGCSIPGAEPAVIYVDYGFAMSRLEVVETIHSPDIDGDGVIGASDETLFLTAYSNKGPVFKADMNMDGAINAGDTAWFYAHKSAALAPPHTPPVSSKANSEADAVRPKEHIVSFTAPRDGWADWRVYSVSGRQLMSGSSSVRLGVNPDLSNGRAGEELGSGTYFYVARMAGEGWYRSRFVVVK